METETSTETSDTTKDSSEIIAEAASSQKWDVQAEASYGGYGFGAKVSAGMESSADSSSKDTASKLSETMKKTAQKMKKQSKVSVTTETEFGFEQETSSTVTNPNDEIAVTYYFYTLQQQYEVQTSLAEVRNVVFVAERVPYPMEIDADWVRRYAGTLVRALLDESLAQTLNEIISSVDEEDLVDADGDDPYLGMLETAQKSFASFTFDNAGAGQGGLTLPDIYSEPQRQLDSYLRDRAERARRNKLRELRRSRLYDHIRQHVLHYCRAVWAAEDADQRLLRYRKEGRTVPRRWRADLLDAGDLGDGVTNVEPTDETVPLADVLDVTGPIGFSGNYIVFPLVHMDPTTLDDSVEVDTTTTPATATMPVQEVLDQVLRVHYADENGIRDPAVDLFEDDAERMIKRAEGHVGIPFDELTYEAPPDALVLDLVTYLPELRAELVEDGAVRRLDGGALLHPVRARDLASYLHLSNATRRFLVEADNLYVSIHRGDGTALEPFKQAHRSLDVLAAAEQLQADRWRNQRRENLLEDAHAFDPDIGKVVVVSDPAHVGAVIGQQTDPAPDPVDS